MRIIPLIFLLSTLLISKSYKLSTIQVPKVKILKRNYIMCDEETLKEYLLDDKVFSFLANIDDSVKDLALREQKLMFEALLNIENTANDTSIRIALLLPDKIIGRYASTTTNAVLAYLMAKNRRFEVKSYTIDNEEKQTIINALQKIMKDKFEFVIAPMTVKGAKMISQINTALDVYFPTLHFSKVPDRNKHMFFGGIDYQAQIEKLLTYLLTDSPVALLYDNGEVGDELNSIVEYILRENYITNPIMLNKAISKDFSDFSPIFEEKKNQQTMANRLKYISFFLNTPIIKTSLILTQLTLYEREPELILSTQINYRPMLLSMTQPQDRDKLLIANSISTKENNNFIVDANKLLNNDIIYNWINYSTTVGTDYFFHIITGTKREYFEKMIDNQIIYPVRIMKPLETRFIDLTEN